MAQRPILISVLAFAAAASVFRTANGPPTAVTHPSGSTELSQNTGQNKIRAKRSNSAVDSWSDRLKNDPKAEGGETARRELRSWICGFILCPIQSKSSDTDPHHMDVPLGEQADSPVGIPSLTQRINNRSPGASQFVPWLTSMPTSGIGPMNQETPEIILAIAPDPVHTHGALLFDRLIDAVEDALQDSGWDYQGSWMPWNVGGPKFDSDTIEDKETNRLFETGREQYPGVILFRPSDTHLPKQQHPLILLVAADSPTTGVVKSQFREALQIFLKLSSNTEQLRILGPDYTGSGPSLYALLRDAKQEDGKPLLGMRSVSIVSGSVSDWYCEHFVPGIHPTTPHLDDCGKSLNKFMSFGVDSGWEMQQIWSFLERRMKANQIAELSEDESGFGELLSSNSDKTGQISHLKFPREISHLRSAYQKNAIWGFGGSSGASSVSLNLDFNEPEEADDSVPSFAQQQLPVSQEASMGQVASIIEEKQIKAVVVSASDVLDELFVAQFLSRRAPNVMIVLRGTDVLFLRSGEGSVYRNMYAVSPWPLVPSNSVWTMSQSNALSSRSFPSGDAEGVYTATRYLVGERTDLLQDYRSPLDAKDSTRRGLIAKVEDRPPLWFSMIGNGAFWPVALLDDPAASKLTSRSSINLPPLPQKPKDLGHPFQAPSLSQRLMLLIAIVLSLLHAGKCLRLRLLERIAPWYHNYEEGTRFPKLVLQLGISILGILMGCLIYEPQVGSDSTGGFLDELPWRVLFFIAITFLATATIQSGWLLWGSRDSQIARRDDRTIDAGVLAILPLFIFGCFFFWWEMWIWLPGRDELADGMSMFFGFRSRHPLSGASPIFPLFLVLNGLTLILLSRLSLLSFSPSMSPRMPDKVPPTLNCPGPDAESKISSLLVWPIEGQNIYEKINSIRTKVEIIGIIMLAVSVVAFSTNLVPKMFERKRTEFLFSVILFLVVVTFLWDLVMAIILWNRLRANCLVPLESSPLRSGFSSISGLTWKSLWLMPQTTDVQYRALTRSLEQATRRSMDCWAGEPIDGESLRDAMDELWQLFTEGKQRDAIMKFGEVQKKMASVGQRLLLRLQQLWAQQVDLVTAPDRTEEKPEISAGLEPKIGQMKRILEEWVALIYIHYIRLVLVQIRTRLATAAALYILLVWSITSYPFINRHSLMIGLSALLGILALVVISTYASINQDPILSRTINEKPDHLDFDFFLKTASMVGIPFLGLVASQFPEVSRFLFSWIEPGLTAVK